MQTSLSAMLPTPASRRFMSDAFLSDDEVLSTWPIPSDFSDNDLSESDLLESDLSKAVPSRSPSASRFSVRTRAETVECPKCSKRSIIRRSHNTFDCLNCNFHKELPPMLIYSQLPTARPSFDELEVISGSDKIQPFVFAAIAVILGIIIL